MGTAQKQRNQLKPGFFLFLFFCFVFLFLFLEVNQSIKSIHGGFGFGFGFGFGCSFFFFFFGSKPLSGLATTDHPRKVVEVMVLDPELL